MTKHLAEKYNTALAKVSTLINDTKNEAAKNHLQLAKAELLAAVAKEIELKLTIAAIAKENE